MANSQWIKWLKIFTRHCLCRLGRLCLYVWPDSFIFINKIKEKIAIAQRYDDRKYPVPRREGFNRNPPLRPLYTLTPAFLQKCMEHLRSLKLGSLIRGVTADMQCHFSGHNRCYFAMRARRDPMSGLLYLITF